MSMLNVIFHHEGDFTRDKNLLYRGGIQTTMYDYDSERYGVFEVINLIVGQRYAWNIVKVQFNLEGIYESFVEVNKDEFVPDVATYVIGNKIERDLYIEHNVKNINVKVVQLQCIDLNERIESSDRDEEPEKSDDDA